MIHPSFATFMYHSCNLRICVCKFGTCSGLTRDPPPSTYFHASSAKGKPLSPMTWASRLMTWITRLLGNPKRKVWCSKAAVSLDYKTKVIKPVGLGEGLARYQRCQKKSCWHVDVYLQTNTNKLLCPNETERLSISPACRTQRIKCAALRYRHHLLV